ncbi:hypothetical protein INT43_003235, partial [Umbelopsis isabellina]
NAFCISSKLSLMATKIYFITGASRGLGLEFVSQLQRAGHTVIATARKPEASEGLQKLVDNKQIYSFALDTLDDKSIDAVIKKVEQIAPDGVDVLINNAGISAPSGSTTLKAAASDYVKVFETNVVGTSNITQKLLPLLQKKKERKIFNISSILGSIEHTYAGANAPYGVSKAAENMFTKTLAEDLKGDNFTVLAIHPGWVQTDMGGASAPLVAKDSIAGMLSVFDKASPQSTGKFLDYQGKELPW